MLDDFRSHDLLAMLGRFTQHTRLIRLTTPLGNDLLAECVRGEESISKGFSFRIDALSTNAHLELKRLLGQPALLQLLTTKDGGSLRPFHGYITGVELTGANGGFARYTITLEPWSTFLSIGRDSRIFQDMTVCDILETVFQGLDGKGKLVPDWRFELADHNVYPKRSLTTQYQESSLAFVERLMQEEGLFYYFEHNGDPDSAALGSHTLVIADHNGAFQANAQSQVRFTHASAVMREDSIDRWRIETRLRTNSVELCTWDYRSVRKGSASAAGGGKGTPQLSMCDMAGVYAWQSADQGQRIAMNQLQAFEAMREVHVGAGTVRSFTAGTTFTLHDHASFNVTVHESARTFALIRVVHLMHNNLNAELRDGVTKLLGTGVVAKAVQSETGLRSPARDIGERPLYRNRFEAILSSVPFRSSSVDEQGRILHPRPTVHGQQTAIVVGAAGDVLHTDRDHRVKIQFHWQRGVASHSRIEHPSPDGHTGAPGDDTAGTWVRVATPMAGANWGTNMLPRVGQEVLVDFFEGDIDRPIVIGALYNGRGKKDAQHNEIASGAGVATGNAPSWFPGEASAHAHPPVLSGFKSQSMAASQSGGDSYRQLVFDDSAGQSRLSLQHHVEPHDGAAELNLGSLRHQSDNALLHSTGFGAELKTDHSATLRAGRGLLLSTSTGSGASGAQLDSGDAAAQINSSHELQLRLATQAVKHNARLENEAEPAELPAVKGMSESAAVIEAVDGAASDLAGGQGKAVSYTEPQLQLSSPAGIVASTPRTIVLTAGVNSSVSAGQDLNIAAQGNISKVVATGVSLFTYGKADNKTKSNQEVGIRLHAASGKLSTTSQSGSSSFTADKAITVASVAKWVAISAPNKHVLLTAQGASIKLHGGNIEVHAPGKVAFKAGTKELAGPVSVPGVDIAMKVSELKIKRDLEIEYVDADGNLLTDEPIAFKFANGLAKDAVLDGSGKAIIKNVPLGPLSARQPRRTEKG